MTKTDDLIAYVFIKPPQRGSAEGRLSSELKQWMEESTRFTAFVETYRDKIRKKIRVNREPDRMLDLGSELEVAYGLLHDRRLAVAYEPNASAKRRGPDFAVTYRTNLVFNIEVTRIHLEESGLNGFHLPRKEERILRILLDKLGQMQPGMANLLVLHTPGALAKSIDLSRLMQAVKTRAEGKDPTFYALSRYTSPTAFYRDYLRLSGILLWSPEAQLWVNKQARPGLPDKVLRLVKSLPPSVEQVAND